MKNTYLAVLALLLASILLIPLVAVASPIKTDKNQPVPIPKADTVRIKNTETGKVEEVALTDYLIGTVSGEMPASYSTEALKSQAVASYTFLLYRRAENGDKDYDITDSFTTDQAYLNSEKLKEKWGDAYTENHEKIKAAVAAVQGMAVTYQGKPILAAYHAISPGKTQSAAEVWGGEYPYLTVVDSIGDLLCPEYLSTVTLTPEEFKKKLEGKVELSGEPKGWLGEVQTTKGSGVKSIKIGGTALEGDAVREIFGLRSAAFDLTFSAETGFTFTVRGYGHGVGMSQYGANYMALQGSTYIEILSWYYKDCKLERL